MLTNLGKVMCCLFIIGGATTAFASPANDRIATVIFVGDITFDGPVKYFAETENTCGYKAPFELVKKELAKADLRVGNLESPLLKDCSLATAADASKPIHHCAEARSVEGLKYAGFDLVQIANNHFADYGEHGIESTMNVLNDAGIGYIGVINKGKNSNNNLLKYRF